MERFFTPSEIEIINTMKKNNLFDINGHKARNLIYENYSVLHLDLYNRYRKLYTRNYFVDKDLDRSYGGL